MDNLSVSECDREAGEEDDEDHESTQENLEELVSHLLKHNLHLQQLLLSKQRRGLMSRKKLRDLAAYETSDTENDDLTSHDSGLPITTINSLTSINTMNNSNHNAGSSNSLEERDESSLLDNIDVSDVGVPSSSAGDYVDRYLSKEEGGVQQIGSSTHERTDRLNFPRDNKSMSDIESSSEATSLYSSAVSVNQPESRYSKETLKVSDSTHYLSDFGARRRAGFVKSSSNYDTFMNMFNSFRRPGEKRSIDNSSLYSAGSITSAVTEGDVNVFDQDLKRQTLRRVHSFNSETNLVKKGDVTLQSQSQSPPNNSHIKDSDNNKDRPISIASFDTSNETLRNKLDNSSATCADKMNRNNSKLQSTAKVNDETCIEKHRTSFISDGVHPEHKIYTKAILSRSSLKNVINKLTNTRKAVSNSSNHSESIHSDLDKVSEDRTPSKLVYTMARQCTRTLKERIKQIRSEEDTSLLNSRNTKQNEDGKAKVLEQIYDLPEYQQGSYRIGAKLATNKEADYQVPTTKPSTVSLGAMGLQTNSGKDAVSLTSSCNGSYEIMKDSIDDTNLDDSSGSFEEFDEDNLVGDCCYEKSFEVIEDLLENDLFRDSAIYSDPEDPDAKLTAADLTKQFPKSILNRVSKSPSLRSDHYIMNTKGVLPKRRCNASASIDADDNQTSTNFGLETEVIDDSPSSYYAKVTHHVYNEIQLSGDMNHSQEATSFVEVNNVSADSSSPASLNSSVISINSVKFNPSASKINYESSHSLIKQHTNVDSSNYSKGAKSSSTTNINSSESIDNENKMAANGRLSPPCSREDNYSVNSSVLVLNVSSSNRDNTDNTSNCEQKLDSKSENLASLPSEISTSRKVPPPVPAKPESMRGITKRSCGTKILRHLKNLEESSKFSKTDTSDCSLNGLKSLQERRQELNSCSKSSTQSECSEEDSQKKEESLDCVCDSLNCICITSNIKNTHSCTSAGPYTKPPQSPLMSVRSFVSRNVANISVGRSSRSTKASATASSKGQEEKLCSNNRLDAKQCCTAKACRHSNRIEECDPTIVKSKTSSKPIHNISITRRKSIKSLGNYISKLNNRSSSVPPRTSHRYESRHSSLPTNSLDSEQSADSSPGSNHSSEESSDGPRTPTMQIKSSASFPEYMTTSSGVADNARFVDCQPASLPITEESGVIIENKRPKGWVKHVVGRLQQIDSKTVEGKS